MENEICSNCEEEFFVVEISMGVPGGKEKENVKCPYCGNIERQSMTDGWFSTSKRNGQ